MKNLKTTILESMSLQNNWQENNEVHKNDTSRETSEGLLKNNKRRIMNILYDFEYLFVDN